MSDESQRHVSTGKCFCPYCSGSIARGMQNWNDQNVRQCRELIEKFSSSQDEKILDEIDEILDKLNPVQVFDFLDEISRNFSSNQIRLDLDNLIVKFVERFRENGGFFLALRQPEERRKNLLERLEKLVRSNDDHRQRLRLTSADLHQ